MTKLKIAGLVALGAVLLGGSLVSAQYYNQYGYAYPTQPSVAYQYPQSFCPALYTNLTLGSRGAQVTELQRFLATHYPQYVTGYYGPQTANNVAQFQRAHGIAPTGGVGPQTRAAITRACGGQTPYPYPTPQPTGGTFRLDRNFTLVPGETKQEYRGELTVALDRIGGGSWYSWDQDSVRITLGQSCPPGLYCAALWYPTESFTLEEDESVEFMDYEITVVEIDRNSVTFRVEDSDRDNDDDDARITITQPTAGEDFEQGDEIRIAWTVREEPRNASVVLELYTESDRRVGTIAIEDGETGSFVWKIPQRNTYCTQQYPNALCGFDLEGDYYIMARLVAGNGFDSTRAYDEDRSGVFTIDD